jgi:hypothetical protein
LLASAAADLREQEKMIIANDKQMDDSKINFFIDGCLA